MINRPFVLSQPKTSFWSFSARPRFWFALAFALILGLLFLSCMGCDNPVAASSEPQVHQAHVDVRTNANGLTVEQENIQKRVLQDNTPGSIKHLYVISPYSGQVILYSTVKGKVTTGGKRLLPSTVAATDGQAVGSEHYGETADIHGHEKYTGEVPDDNGTYGSSGDYIYWWDVRGTYHQHYMTGGQIVTIADQPLPVKSVIINIESTPSN